MYRDMIADQEKYMLDKIIRVIKFSVKHCIILPRWLTAILLILKKEKNHKLYFTPLQSELGKKILEHFDLKDKADTMVLVENGKLRLIRRRETLEDLLRTQENY